MEVQRSRQQCHSEALLSIISNLRGRVAPFVLSGLAGCWVPDRAEHIRDPELLRRLFPLLPVLDWHQLFPGRDPSWARKGRITQALEQEPLRKHGVGMEVEPPLKHQELSEILL